MIHLIRCASRELHYKFCSILIFFADLKKTRPRCLKILQNFGSFSKRKEIHPWPQLTLNSSLFIGCNFSWAALETGTVRQENLLGVAASKIVFLYEKPVYFLRISSVCIYELYVFYHLRFLFHFPSLMPGLFSIQSFNDLGFFLQKSSTFEHWLTFTTPPAG